MDGKAEDIREKRDEWYGEKRPGKQTTTSSRYINPQYIARDSQGK